MAQELLDNEKVKAQVAGQHRRRDLVGAARRHARHRRTDRRRSARRAQRRTHHRSRHQLPRRNPPLLPRTQRRPPDRRPQPGRRGRPRTDRIDLTEAAAAIPADTDWSIDLPTENIPNSSPVKTFLETSVPFLAGISLVMVLMAFLATSDRPSVLRKAAFWATGTTAVYLIVGYGVPACCASRSVIRRRSSPRSSLPCCARRSSPRSCSPGWAPHCFSPPGSGPTNGPSPHNPGPVTAHNSGSDHPHRTGPPPGECATSAARHPAVDTGRTRHTTVQPRRPGRRRAADRPVRSTGRHPAHVRAGLRHGADDRTDRNRSAPPCRPEPRRTNG